MMLCLVVGALALVAAMLIRREPSYEGKRLSEWLNLLPSENPFPESDPAFHAIVEMGEPAVRALTKQFLAQHNRLIEAASRINFPWFVRWSEAAAKRRLQAFFALQSLGPRAQPATPELVAFVKSRDPKIAGNAINLLGSIHSHPDLAIPVLTNCLNANHVVRHVALRALGQYGTNALAAAPIIRGMLTERDFECRYTAATALLGIGDSVDTSLAVIKQALQHADSMIGQRQAYQLGQLGDHAKPAVPLMVEAMTNADNLLRRQIINMLANIDTRVAADLKAQWLSGR